jgi:type VI secretion system secreted protein Hcp
MAFDAFLKLEGIKGESTDAKHKAEIDIESFSWGAVQSVGATGGGKSAGKASISSFNFLKKTDSSSAVLFQGCCTGQHFKDALVTIRRAGGKDPVEYLKYKFSDVMVEAVQWSGSAGGEETPSESVTLAFNKVEITYTPMDATGKPGSPVVTSYDIRAGTAK